MLQENLRWVEAGLHATACKHSHLARSQTDTIATETKAKHYVFTQKLSKQAQFPWDLLNLGHVLGCRSQHTPKKTCAVRDASHKAAL